MNTFLFEVTDYWPLVYM